MVDKVSRYKGCLLGLACGDAVGTTVEFSPRGTFTPVVDLLGGGPFDLEPGQWTDDTSMALCLATSLVYREGFDATDQMNRYCNWRSVGYLSSNGRCFDIGMTVAAALDRYLLSGDPFAGDPNPRSAGNGALMRLAPVSMFYSCSAAETWHFAGESTRTTHGAQEAIECSRVFGLALRNALLGVNKTDLLRFDVSQPLTAKIADLVRGEFLTKQRGDVNGTGYCVESLEAALWSFYSTDSFEQAILAAVNLGDDADTTAAICGQLAGAYYGVDAIPPGWRKKLTMRDDIEALAQQLYECSGK
ncbi:MAG: ADP-ribosylglycohydrolase family protein [Pseudomonadota bacterium]